MVEALRWPLILQLSAQVLAEEGVSAITRPYSYVVRKLVKKLSSCSNRDPPSQFDDQSQPYDQLACRCYWDRSKIDQSNKNLQKFSFAKLKVHLGSSKFVHKYFEGWNPLF